MSAPVDYSREACERLAGWIETSGIIPERNSALAEAPALILGLRAALDAAEREKDEAHKQGYCEGYEDGEKAAATTHHARGVRDAAGVLKKELNLGAARIETYDSILALLPANKETPNAE